MNSEVVHQIGEAQPVEITWAPVAGAKGYSVLVSPSEPGLPPLPRGYRKLERALRRLEAVVTVWERALEGPTTYGFSITAIPTPVEMLPIPTRARSPWTAEGE